MPTPLPQASGEKSTVHLRSRPSLRYLGGGLVALLGLLEIPHLPVGEVLDHDQGHEGAGKYCVGNCHRGLESGCDKEDVGWCCYGEKDELGEASG